jgi:hypothetical protein
MKPICCISSKKFARRPPVQLGPVLKILLYLCMLAHAEQPADSLNAPQELPSSGATLSTRGSISVSSQPPQAEIILDGEYVNMLTPSVIENIDTGMHTLEVSVPDYLFSRRKIRVIGDSAITVSFQLISSLDTAYIIGDRTIGVLSLPRQYPASPPYVVDGVTLRALQIALNEGSHRVQWDGRGLYESLDTVVIVHRGQITYVNFSPRRLTGILDIAPYPTDAEVIVDGRSYGFGLFSRLLPTGPHELQVQRPGFYRQRRTVEVFPKRRTSLDIILEQIPDRDGDGFLDSLDHCPDDYGLYAGCPKPRFVDAMRQNIKRLQLNMQDDPLIFAFNVAGFMHRYAANERFAELLSYFTDGKPYGNNVTGIVAANTFAVSWRGIMLEYELGQWNEGRIYRKSDTLTIETSRDSYILFYDSLAGIEPSFIIPSTSLSLGFHFAFKWLDVGYSVGRQWEDIILADIVRRSDSEILNVLFDNDWWFHRLHAEINFEIDAPFIPALYSHFTFPFGSKHRCGWHMFECGAKLKFRPVRRRAKAARSTINKENRQ